MKVLNQPWPQAEQKPNQYRYPFPLDDFQAWAIDSMHKGGDVLITAHTGSGKTLPAEDAIQTCIEKQRKLIYTSPIKSLSNQKFADFSSKFGGEYVGILTGDIKYNPDALILIMTTEILRNHLAAKEVEKGISLIEDLKMEDVDFIVLDEVHYMNDVDRGSVWEDVIVRSPNHLSLIMLSATIDQAEYFATWIEKARNKECYLIPNERRVVPLEHCLFFKYKESFKTQNEGQLQLDDFKPHKVYDSPVQKPYDLALTQKILKQIDDKRTYSGRFLFEQCLQYIQQQDLFPCLTFTFSRNKCEINALSLTQNLHQGKQSAEALKALDKLFYEIPKDIRENLLQDTFDNLKKTISKGIGFHHSGLHPMVKEIIEILYGQGHIKLLFATETFAVGVNLPTRSVIFPQIQKFTNGGFRTLHPFEYSQMAGRAGRRGLDDRGVIFHLVGYDRKPQRADDYYHMIQGNQPSIKSHMKPTYQMALQSIDQGQTPEYLQRTLASVKISNYAQQQLQSLGDQPIDPNSQQKYEQIFDFMELKNDFNKDGSKKSKKVRTVNEKKVKKLLKDTKFKKEFEQYNTDLQNYNNFSSVKESFEIQLKGLESQLYTQFEFCKGMDLIKDGKLTLMGQISLAIQEPRSILLAISMIDGKLASRNLSEIGAIVAGCIIEQRKKDDNVNNQYRMQTPHWLSKKISQIVSLATAYQIPSFMTIEFNERLAFAVYNWILKQDWKLFIEQSGQTEGDCVRDCLRLYQVLRSLEKINTIIPEQESQKFVETMDLIIKPPITNESIYMRRAIKQ